MLYIGLNREKHIKIFLPETIRPRALIFGMMHNQVVFYQVFVQIIPLGPKLAPPPRSHALHRLK